MFIVCLQHINMKYEYTQILRRYLDANSLGPGVRKKLQVM